MNILVTFKTFNKQKEFLTNALSNEASVYFKEDLTDNELANIIQQADILLSWNP
ncbi:MAG: hypothetical protein GX459_12960, partial [Bacteroidales bacterium]|nr:hypothetical protein [Bacteroidales bacterium]